jgi:hypothetical protein
MKSKAILASVLLATKGIDSYKDTAEPSLSQNSGVFIGEEIKDPEH